MATEGGRSAGRALVVLGVLTVAAFILGIAFGGTVFLPSGQIIHEIFKGYTGDGYANQIVWQLRLPTACACVLVGGILGIVGSAFQALFRNPLADPFIIGVASGSAVGGVLALVLGLTGTIGTLAMPLFGFVFGLGALWLVFVLSRRHGAVDVSTLLLAGVITGSLLMAIQSLILLLARQDAGQVIRWMLGSMHPMFWDRVTLMLFALAIGGFLLIRQARALNALAIGEETARRLGIDVRRLRNTILIAGTAMVAVCVGSVGIIGFLGLAAPHIARRLTGVDWRGSLIGSMMCGSILLLIADVAAQQLSVFTVSELPVGVVTALMGAPFLLVLLRKD